MNWYPISFEPIFKEKIWGGDKLNSLKDLKKPIKNLGESWELSDVDDNVSIINAGEFKGKSLRWFLEHHADDVLGIDLYRRFGKQFPILIKYIDTARDLSIQLHPDDKVALKKHNSFGKTEMWYIMNADPNAQLTLGFKEDCDKHAFAKAIQNNSITALLNNESVAAGDSFYIKPGFVHAIGAGITLAEIQQTSDITYRIYDYDRCDDEGRQRDLHIKDSIEAADYEQAKNYKLDYDPIVLGRQELKKSDYFKTDIQQFEDKIEIELKTGNSFTVLMNVGDDCEILHNDNSYHFKNSQTYLIPAVIEKIEALSKGKGKLLIVQL